MTYIAIEKEKIELAIEALENIEGAHSTDRLIANEAIKALEEALAKQEVLITSNSTELENQKQAAPIAHHLEPSTRAGLQSIDVDLPTTQKQEQGEPVYWSDEQLKMLNFLYGAGDFDGVWFEQKHPTEKGAFWWRKHMKRLFDYNVKK